MGTHVREQESYVPSRRQALRAIGVGGLVATLPADGMALAGKLHPDAELIRLDAEFDRLHAAALPWRRAAREAWARCRDILDAQGGVTSKDSWQAACLECGIYEIDGPLEAAEAAVEEVTAVIRSIPARTITGISVKARVVFEEVFSGYVEGGSGHISEIDVRTYVDFMGEIDALVGEVRA